MDTDKENELRGKNQATVEKFFNFDRKVSSTDDFMALFTEDAVWELPWTEPLLKWSGKNSVKDHFVTTRKNVKEWKFIKIRVNPALDPNKFFIEVEAQATFIKPGGELLSPKIPNRYIFVFTMEDGKIKHAGEHFDRLFAMQAMGMPVPQFQSPKMGN